MTTAEAAAFTARLRQSKSVAPYELKVDTFHHPYLEFRDSFTWPAVSLAGLRSEEASAIVSILADRFPNLQTFHVMPDPKPKKDLQYLNLVHRVPTNGLTSALLIRIATQYMGGAERSEMITIATQEKSPSYSTNRIYFHARLLPVIDWRTLSDQLLDFEVKKLKEAVFLFSSDSTIRDVWSTILFDEVDFSHLDEQFTRLFCFGEEWKPKKVFLPFLIDYLTLSINCFNWTNKFFELVSPPFLRAYETFSANGSLEELSSHDKDFWRQYINAFSYVRVFSRSGNVHWKITSFPYQEE